MVSYATVVLTSRRLLYAALFARSNQWTIGLTDVSCNAGAESVVLDHDFWQRSGSADPQKVAMTAKCAAR